MQAGASDVDKYLCLSAHNDAGRREGNEGCVTVSVCVQYMAVNVTVNVCHHFIKKSLKF